MCRGESATIPRGIKELILTTQQNSERVKVGYKGKKERIKFEELNHHIISEGEEQ